VAYLPYFGIKRQLFTEKRMKVVSSPYSIVGKVVSSVFPTLKWVIIRFYYAVRPLELVFSFSFSTIHTYLKVS